MSVPECEYAQLYKKWVFSLDGEVTTTDMPLDVLFPEGWKDLRVGSTTRAAYSFFAGKHPRNNYWNHMHGRRAPTIRGTVVLFRPHEDVEWFHVYPVPKPLMVVFQNKTF